MTVPFMKTGNTVSILAQGKWYQVKPEHPNYAEILDALHGTEEDMVKLLDIASSIEDYSSGNVEVVGGAVKYDGEVVDNSLTRRIVDFMREGLPFEPLTKLFENLMKNISYQTRTQLYDFLEHKNLPITEDGCFLAYKAVNSSYMDKYTGTMNNSVGETVSIDRGKVDDNRDKGCSAGLHCGALDYVRDYGSEDSGDHIMIVKVNPMDAVSVPHDCQHQKLRVCQYEVVAEMEWSDELRKPLYSADGQEYQSFVQDDYDDDWHDEEWDETYDAVEARKWLGRPLDEMEDEGLDIADDLKQRIQDMPQYSGEDGHKLLPPYAKTESEEGKLDYLKKIAYNSTKTMEQYLKKVKELIEQSSKV